MAEKIHNARRQKIVRDWCEKRPDWPTLTLAKKIYADHPKLFTTLHSARLAIGYVRGNMGERNRRKAIDKSLHRPNGSQSDRTPLPESRAVPWEPYFLETRRTLVLSDPHIPFHNSVALEAALAYGDAFKPDTILVNGDAQDFEALSRFDRSADGPTTDDELAAGRRFWTHLRERFGWHVKLVYKLGNHDERWELYLWRKAPELAKTLTDVWEHFIGTDALDITVVKDQRPVMCGKLPILHGHELQKGIAAPVNPARGAFLKTHHTILVGHSHQTSGHADTNLFHEETFCWSTGCLCDLTPRYARVNRWNHGFATVEVEKDGSFGVSNLRIKNGRVRKS